MTKTALLIGVSKYEADLPPLPAVVNDIEAMRQVLADPKIGGFDNVEVCVEPDLVEMRRAIGRLFRTSKKGDLALLFFAGHGMTDDSGKLYLTTPITRKEECQETSVPASFVHDMMNNSPCKRQVVILDCCYSGAFAQGWQPRGDINIQQQLGGEGRAILTSSSAIQLSFEQEGAGIYTRYLIEGMRTGTADRDGDGQISIQELHEYAKEQVQTAKPAMKPEIYTHKEGFEIYLTQAPVNDPELIYRREVEKRVKQNKGELSWINRRTLERLASDCNIISEVAEQIISEVLAPYAEHKQNLKEYQEVFAQAIQEEYPLSDRIRQDLQDFQQILGLTDEDVERIEKQVLSKAELPPVIPEPSSIQPTKSEPEQQLLTFEFDVVTLDKTGKESQRQRKSAQYFIENIGNGVTLDMVKIPAGEFLMGSPESEKRSSNNEAPQLGSSNNERPQHRVRVDSFFMGKYPVTQAQWKAVASLPKLQRDLNPDPSNFKGENRPVECVSWYDAVEFCARLSKHTGKSYLLPSEAQWEYACRAGTTSPFHFGETISTDVANYDGKYIYGSGSEGVYRRETTPVGSFQVANNFGLFDMHGNVGEWCADPWHNNYEGAPADGSVWDVNDNRYKRYIDNLVNLMSLDNKVVLRGGSRSRYPSRCRSASRDYDFRRDFINDFVGFRVLCVPGFSFAP